MTASPSTATKLIAWLRAAGETTRLRLLLLCAERDLSVSDLATAVRQSEPRVSRHLKILSDAGLIVRLRQGQWVHYQVASDGAAAAFVQGLIAQLDRADPSLARDRASLRMKGAEAQLATVETRLGRSLRAFLETDGPRAPLGSVLIVGVEHLELLSALGVTAQRCAAISRSRRGAQAARAFLEREDLNCRVLIATAESINTRDTERAGQPFDAIALDRLAATAQDLSRDLAVMRQALTPGGRLWLFERYDALESPRGRVVEHPLSRLRRLLSEAGFAYERLSPVEADGEHVLAATAIAAARPNARVA